MTKPDPDSSAFLRLPLAAGPASATWRRCCASHLRRSPWHCRDEAPRIGLRRPWSRRRQSAPAPGVGQLRLTRREGGFARLAFEPFRSIPGILGVNKSARADVRGYRHDEPPPPCCRRRQPPCPHRPYTTFDRSGADIQLHVRCRLGRNTPPHRGR